MRGTTCSLMFLAYETWVAGRTVGLIEASQPSKKVLIVSPFALLIGIFNPLLDTRTAIVIAGVPLSAGLLSFFSILLKFGLTARPAAKVGAPLIDECHVNLECRVVDTGMVAKYCLFVVEVVEAWIDPAIRNPRTIHHLGSGNFMVAGERIKLKSRMK